MVVVEQETTFFPFICLLDIAKMSFSVIILNSGFRIPDSGFRFPVSGFLVLGLPVNGTHFERNLTRLPRLDTIFNCSLTYGQENM